MPTQKPTWEERFDEKFEGELWLGKTGEIQDDDGEPDTPDRRELKDFIRQLLQQERERIVEKTNDLGFISNNQKEQLSKELELLSQPSRGTMTMKQKPSEIDIEHDIYINLTNVNTTHVDVYALEGYILEMQEKINEIIQYLDEAQEKGTI